MPPRIPKIVCTKSGGSQQLAVEIMRQRVEMADIVAFAFEARAAALAELFDELLDLRERVGDDALARLLDIGLLPVVLPVGDLGAGMEDAEIHRAHVERAEFRLGPERRCEPVLDAHAERAAGRDVDDGVAALLDARQELHEDRRDRASACRSWDRAHEDG